VCYDERATLGNGKCLEFGEIKGTGMKERKGK